MRATPDTDAEQLAEDLLGEISRARAGSRVRAPQPPFLLRSPDLMALAPPLRAQVLVHARRGLLTDPRVILFLLAYGAAALALLFLAAPGQLGLLIALGWMPAWLVHAGLVRRAARKLARALAALP